MGACASTSTSARSLKTDFRGHAAVSTLAPQLLVTGPVQVLHANYERRAAVTFFKTAPRDGVVAVDCSGGAPVRWDGKSVLEIREGESLCVAATRKVNLSWHARSGVEPPHPTQHASR